MKTHPENIEPTESLWKKFSLMLEEIDKTPFDHVYELLLETRRDLVVLEEKVKQLENK